MVISKRVFNESLTTRIHVCLLGNNNCNSKEISLGSPSFHQLGVFFIFYIALGADRRKQKLRAPPTLTLGPY